MLDFFRICSKKKEGKKILEKKIGMRNAPLAFSHEKKWGGGRKVGLFDRRGKEGGKKSLQGGTGESGISLLRRKRRRRRGEEGGQNQGKGRSRIKKDKINSLSFASGRRG